MTQPYRILLRHQYNFFHALLEGCEPGIGNTPAEALGSLMINNPEVFGVRSAKLDLRDASTLGHFMSSGLTKDRVI